MDFIYTHEIYRFTIFITIQLLQGLLSSAQYHPQSAYIFLRAKHVYLLIFPPPYIFPFRWFQWYYYLYLFLLSIGFELSLCLLERFFCSHDDVWYCHITSLCSDCNSKNFRFHITSFFQNNRNLFKSEIILIFQTILRRLY